jgi:hypothetical protein
MVRKGLRKRMNDRIRHRVGWLISLSIVTALLASWLAVSTAQTAGASSQVYRYPPTETPTRTPTSVATPAASRTNGEAVPVPLTPDPTATATPLPTPDGVQRQASVPILMYHYLSEPPPGPDRYREDLSVSPQLFEQHLAFLQAEGYTAISLYDLLYHLALGRPLPDRPVIITFDDGYVDNYENAFPLLEEYGFNGSFFVVSELAERAQAGMTAPNGFVYADNYMDWDQLREMSEAGMDIECHARVHENLTLIDRDRLVWQVLGCREMIERELGQRPRSAATTTMWPRFTPPITTGAASPPARATRRPPTTSSGSTACACAGRPPLPSSNPYWRGSDRMTG